MRSARRRFFGLVSVVFGLALLAPGSASAIGELTQKAGTDGCVYEGGAGGQCGVGDGVGNTDSAVSPDGKNVYTVSFSNGTLAILDRNPATGALTQKPGADGCFRDDSLAATGCESIPRLLKPSGIAVSPDGKHVYVSDYDSTALTIFERNETNGELTVKAGSEGCHDNGSSAFCELARAMGRPDRIVISSNGANVYVAGSDGGNSVVIFDRDTGTGELAQKAGTAGCVSDNGSGGECQDGKALFHVEGLAISPDGKSVYATSRFTDAIAVLDRNVTTGELTQKAGTAGCISEDGSGGECADGVALDSGSPHLKSPVVSPDGENVYMPTSDSNAVAIFDRDTSTGALTQKAGTAGCISEDGTAGACQDGRGLTDAFDSGVSADGLSVYIGGSTIVVLDRDPDTGALTQKAGTAGCVSDDGSGGQCTDGFGNGGLGGAPTLSGDGRNLYAGMANDDGLAVFDRDAPTTDGDNDGIPDAIDNCDAVPNAEQDNADGDAEGDACDNDDDNDGKPDASDACPTLAADTADGCPPLVLDRIDPSRGGQGVVTVALRGSGLTGNTAVALKRSGEADVVASETSTSAGGRTLHARFNLAGKAVGLWDVVASRPGTNTSTSLPKAFRIQRATAADIGVQVIGPRAALGNYPATLTLQLTNYGNVDATNALVRLDGFESGSEVRGFGSGVTALEGDDGTDHGVIVSVDRVNAGATKRAFVRFVPIGNAHALYRLQPRVIGDTVPGADVGPTDPTLDADRQPSSATASTEAGVFKFTGSAGTADIAYSAQLSAGAPAQTAITRTGGGASVTYEFQAALPKPGTGPPNGSPTGANGNLKLTLQGSEGLLNGILAVKDGTGNNALTAQRRHIADCLLARKYIDQGQHTTLNELAAGGQTITALKLALAENEADAILSGQFETFAALFGDEWERTLIQFLKAAAAKDPNNPFFKGKSDSEINGAVLELCRREESSDGGGGEFPPPPDPPEPPPPPPHVTEVVYPADPNDKAGPPGYGAGHFVAPGTPASYLIMFENKPDASAPAHEVRITDQLDPTRLDLRTFELGPLYFGADRVATPPPGAQSWTDFVDLRPDLPLIVRIDAGLNRTTGVAAWHLQGLNPDTGELETDPLIGFLPPNQNSPEGQGGVTFNIDPVDGLGTGDQIANKASIVFDLNAAIETPTFTNTIDDSAPTSSIKSAKLKGGDCRKLNVKFAGKDKGAGIAFRDLYVSKNGAKYRAWRLNTSAKKGLYEAKKAGAYAFMSIATDGAGHAEPTTSRLWDAIVKKVKRSGQSALTLSLDKKGAKALGVKSLKVKVDGRRKASTKKVPGKIKLTGLRSGAHEIALDARLKAGKPKKMRDERTVVSCPKAKKK